MSNTFFLGGEKFFRGGFPLPPVVKNLDDIDRSLRDMAEKPKPERLRRSSSTFPNFHSF